MKAQREALYQSTEQMLKKITDAQLEAVESLIVQEYARLFPGKDL